MKELVVEDVMADLLDDVGGVVHHIGDYKEGLVLAEKGNPQREDDGQHGCFAVLPRSHDATPVVAEIHAHPLLMKPLDSESKHPFSPQLVGCDLFLYSVFGVRIALLKERLDVLPFREDVPYPPVEFPIFFHSSV